MGTKQQAKNLYEAQIMALFGETLESEQEAAAVKKYNPNHDEKGRFADSDSGPAIAHTLAQARLTKANADKPILDKLVTATAEKSGGHLIVDPKTNTLNSVKSEDSLTRKIIEEAPQDRVSLQNKAAAISDVNRYTITYPPDKLVAGEAQVSKDLQAQGFELYDHKASNYFGASQKYGYEGYNTVWKNDQTGASFELQFHTPQSVDLKEQAHPFYSQFRTSKDPGEQSKLLDQMSGIYKSANITRPAGHESLTSYLPK